MFNQMKAIMRDLVVMSVSTGSVDIYGQRYVGSTTTVYAHVEHNEREYPTFDGVAQRSTHRLFLDETVPPPDLNTKFWIEGASSSDASLARRPKSVKKYYDVKGSLYLYEVDL